MKRGLVIGKFLPPHQGHIELIHFALQHCDQLVVSLSFTPDDPIPYPMRVHWLQEIFKSHKNISIHTIADDFDDLTLPLPQRTKIWADVIHHAYGNFDVLVSSEEYGSYFAMHLHASHVLFDKDRVMNPVSGTAIRNHPHEYWDFIPKVVRPWYVKIICFNGPESTGKSVMAKKMADRFNTEFVPEVARELITTNDFSIDDIIRIGKAQTERVLEKLQIANRFLFCDSDVITTQIYSQYYLNEIPEILFDLEKQITYDHYFLFDIDVPWVADGLRDLGSREQRQQMYTIFRSELEKRGIQYTPVHGNWSEREAIILKVLEDITDR